MILKKIKPISMARIFSALYMVIGFIFGLFNSVNSIIHPSSYSGVGFRGMLVGSGAVVFFPLVYALIGFLVGFITALLYNLVAKRIGGLEFVLE